MTALGTAYIANSLLGSPTSTLYLLPDKMEIQWISSVVKWNAFAGQLSSESLPQNNTSIATRYYHFKFLPQTTFIGCLDLKKSPSEMIQEERGNHVMWSVLEGTLPSRPTTNELGDSLCHQHQREVAESPLFPSQVWAARQIYPAAVCFNR